MKIIAVVIGHGPRIDMGAEHSDGTTEFDYNTGLADDIKQAIGDRAKAIIVHRTIERLQPVVETNETNADAAVELHCNSFNKIATGTEMIYWPGSTKSMRLASLLQTAAVNVLRLPSRGIKGPQGGGRGERWLRGTRMPAVIVESFFIDNTNDLIVGVKKQMELAKAYADALVQFVTV